MSLALLLTYYLRKCILRVFIPGLFNDTFVFLKYTVSNDGLKIGNGLKRIQKEAIASQFNIIFRNLSGRTEESHEVS